MLLSKFLFKLYALKIGRLKKAIRALVTNFEGGQIYSETLRAIFSKYHKIEIGMYSYGGCFNANNICPHTKIGRYCSFAGGVCIFRRNHPIKFRSTHPFFYNPALGIVEHEMITRGKLVVGNDVWIGQNALILPSVGKIGDGA